MQSSLSIHDYQLFFFFILLSSVSCFGQSSPPVDTNIVVNSFYVYFDSGKSNLDSTDLNLLKTSISRDTFYSYNVVGHTDSDGSDRYNVTLSHNRALAVAMFIVDSLLIDSSQVGISYAGEMKPIASNHSNQGKQLNRRVSIEKYLPVKIRYLAGRVISNENIPIVNGNIYMQSRFYRDSTLTDVHGNFVLPVPVPDNSFVRINATAHNHFYIDTLLKITPRIENDSLKVTIPHLRDGQRYTLPEMFFVGNQDVLLFRSLSSLAALTKTMVNSDVCAIIEGHVNLPGQPPQHPGTFSYNLSVARAMKIRNHLMMNNVDSTRLNPLGYSNWYMDYPYAVSEKEQELNRRVEMIIKDCNRLYEFTQDDLIIPDNIGTTRRLLNKN